MLSKPRLSAKHEDGFTLIELLVVIIIIGILAAIAIPLFLDQRKLAVDASVKADVRNTVANIQTWQASTEANRTKAEANTGAYVTDGGKIAQTPGNSIGVSIDASGAATVCAYNSGGKTYLADSSAYVFNPATGQFTTGSCATSSTAGGTSSNGGSASSPVTIASYNFNGSVQGWVLEPGASGSASVFTATVNTKTGLRIADGGDNTAAKAAVILPTAMVAGKSYTVIANVYLSTGNAAWVSVGNGVTNKITGAGTWSPVTATFTADGTDPTKMYFNITSAAGVNALVDDVVLTQNN